jgi:hypothetical protein
MFAVGGVRRQSDFGCSGAEHSNASQFNKEAVKIFIFPAPPSLGEKHRARRENCVWQNYFPLREKMAC